MNDPRSNSEIRLGLVIRGNPSNHPLTLQIGQSQGKTWLPTILRNLLDKLKGNNSQHDQTNQ